MNLLVDRSTRIGIVGAGIGGLSTGIALTQRGFDVRILERAPELTEVGAGIVMGPNAMKVLRALGLEPAILKVAFEPDRHLLHDWRSGRVLHDTPMRGTFDKRFGAGYLQVHRADLLNALKQVFPASRLSLGRSVKNVQSSAKSVGVFFEDGSSEEFSAVIGADGINSVVRESLFGALKPRFTGNVCWRGTVPVDRIPGLFTDDIHVWLGPNGHVVNYLIRRGKVMNFVAIAKADDWRSEAWAVEADKSELIDRYRDWNPALLTLFNSADRCYKWAMFDRDPLPCWTQGRVTILGDAAHPMLPYLAQGGAMALEDGYTLAALLHRLEGRPLEEALKEFERIRLPRTSRVQLGARARSKENHVASPWARFARDAKYAWRRFIRPQETSYQVEWIYSYDVAAEFA